MDNKQELIAEIEEKDLLTSVLTELDSDFISGESLELANMLFVDVEQLLNDDSNFTDEYKKGKDYIWTTGSVYYDDQFTSGSYHQLQEFAIDQLEEYSFKDIKKAYNYFI